MSWVPPFFTCGVCGGEIGRWPMLNLLRQEILDWRHRAVPPGVEEHRAVLGTPAHKPRIEASSAGPERSDNAGDETSPVPAPPPELPARPALHGELPGAAERIDKLAAANGWEVEAWIMRGTLMDARWRPSRVRSSAVLRGRRDGLGVVACWATDTQGTWKFDEAFLVGHFLEPLSSPELRAVLSEPRARCESCGEPPRLHVTTPTGPVCFSEHALSRA